MNFIRRPTPKPPEICSICGNHQGPRQGQCAIGWYHQFPRPEQPTRTHLPERRQA